MTYRTLVNSSFYIIINLKIIEVFYLVSMFIKGTDRMYQSNFFGMLHKNKSKQMVFETNLL